MKIGERIKDIRTTQNMKLKDVAAESGLSISYISDIENGRSIPTLSTLASIASVFNMLASDMLQGVSIDDSIYKIGLRPIPDERQQIHEIMNRLGVPMGTLTERFTLLLNNSIVFRFDIPIYEQLANIPTCFDDD